MGNTEQGTGGSEETARRRQFEEVKDGERQSREPFSRTARVRRGRKEVGSAAAAAAREQEPSTQSDRRHHAEREYAVRGQWHRENTQHGVSARCQVRHEQTRGLANCASEN